MLVMRFGTREDGVIVGDAPWHTLQAGIRTSARKATLKPIWIIQKLIQPQLLVHHAPGHLGEPVVDRREEAHQRAADDSEVEVRGDEHAAVQLHIRGHVREEDA